MMGKCIIFKAFSTVLKGVVSKRFSGGKPPDVQFCTCFLLGGIFWHIGLCLSRQRACRSILAASEMQVLHGLGSGVVKYS